MWSCSMSFNLGWAGRDGGSFKTRSVKATQDNRTICLSQMSFHKLEFGHEYQVELSELLDGIEIPPPQLKFDQNSQEKYIVAEGDKWVLHYVKLNMGGIDIADWRTHCSLLTYLSDQVCAGET